LNSPLLFSLWVKKNEETCAYTFHQLENSAQAMNLELNPWHSTVDLDSYKIKLYSEELNKEHDNIFIPLKTNCSCTFMDEISIDKNYGPQIKKI
jgi:hypothetical protein